MPTASPSCATASLVATGDTSDFDRDKIIAAMVGRALSGQLYRKRDEAQLRKPGQEGALGAGHFDGHDGQRNKSFSVFEGQMTGVFGLIGSGRTETFKIVAGIYKRDFLRGGTIVLDDRPVRYIMPAEAVKDGIVYVTEDRKSEGIFETMSIGENLFGGLLAAGREQGLLVQRPRHPRACARMDRAD